MVWVSGRDVLFINCCWLMMVAVLFFDDDFYCLVIGVSWYRVMVLLCYQVITSGRIEAMTGSVVVYDAREHTAHLEGIDDDAFGVMSNAVGGYLEHVYDDSFGKRFGIDLWVNDSGAVDGLPYAFTATVNGCKVPLFGNVVFAKCDDEGDTIGLSESDIVWVGKLLSPVLD